MILTDRFVYVHQPKTGGTFVTTVLDKIHQPPLGLRWIHPTNILRHERTYQGRYGSYSKLLPKHGTCMKIPEPHQHKAILASIRNPYERYVSMYEFGWWKKPFYLPHFQKIPGFTQNYPHFPDLTFEEYVMLVSTAFRRMENHLDGSADEFGPETDDFVRFYFHKPRKVFASADDSYFSSGAYMNDMFNVQFVRTRRLNEDLYQFLLRMDYPCDDVAFVLNEGRIDPRLSRLGEYVDAVFPGLGRSQRHNRRRRAKRPWPEYYTPELKEFVRRRERALFELFPDFDV